MECANCGADLQTGKKFCIACGHRVPAAPTPPTEEWITSHRDVFTDTREGPWLRKLLWGTGMIGTLALTSRRMVLINSKVGLERLSGGPKVESLEQMEELLASRGGFSIPRSEVQAAWISATGHEGPPSGRGDYAELAIRHADTNLEKTFRFYGPLRSGCLAAAEEVRSLLAVASEGVTSEDAQQQSLREMNCGPGDMERTLRELGVALDFSTTDPQTALIGGFAKASIYKGYRTLSSGQNDAAIDTFTTVIDFLGKKGSDRFAEPLAVAHCLRGRAYEGKKLLDQARGEYASALRVSPDHRAAREAYERLSRRS